MSEAQLPVRVRQRRTGLGFGRWCAALPVGKAFALFILPFPLLFAIAAAATRPTAAASR